MDGTALQVVRVGVLLIGLVDVLIGTNYMNIQQLFPFLRKAPGSWKTNSGLRAAGVILAMVIATFVLFALMVFVVQILFGGDQQLWSQ